MPLARLGGSADAGTRPRKFPYRHAINGKKRTFTLAGDFEGTSTDHDFIEPLWAARKVGYLLDEIRLHGENGELREEVVRLSKKYGIVTPYTSYLIVEDDAALPVTAAQPREVRRLGAAVRTRIEQPVPQPQRNAPLALGKAMGRIAGEKAVQDARVLREWKQAHAAPTRDKYDVDRVVARVARKSFVRRNETWIDSEAADDDRTALAIRFGSKAYFDLLAKYPELKPIFALGANVNVRFKNVILRIGEKGKTELATADWNLIE